MQERIEDILNGSWIGNRLEFVKTDQDRNNIPPAIRKKISRRKKVVSMQEIFSKVSVHKN